MQSSLSEAAGSQIWQPRGRMGQYTLLAKLAVGGMAEIWLARQSGLKGFERVVVVKRISEAFSADPEFVEMFLDEARIAAQLNHPNIVQIYELGQSAGSYYIVMEYLNGENVAAIARRARERRESLPLTWLARVIANAAEGLAYAHEKRGLDGRPLKIVHRDVSPQNILVTYEGIVKVVDFGIAKAANRATRTVTNTFKGKFAYMSPEQARSLPLDGRSDVFALGIVLYEALTGKRLFHFEDPGAAIRAISGGPPIPFASTERPDVPPELDEIVSRALKRELDMRYPSARALQEDLEQWLRQQNAGSTAEVARLMRDSFAQRMEERARLLDSALAEEVAPSQLQAVVATPAPMPGGTDGVDRPRTADTQVRSTHGGRLGLGLGVGVAAALAALGGWFVAQQWERPPAPPPLQPLVPAEVAAPVPAVPPPAPEPAPDPPRVADSPKAAQEAPVPRPSSAKGPARVAARAPQATGKLSLVTTPWTRVFLGSKTIGDTPLVGVTVPAGKLSLRLVNEEKKVNTTIQVEIEAGKLTLKKLRL